MKLQMESTDNAFSNMLVTHNKAWAAGCINKPQGRIFVEGSDLHLPSMASSMLGLTEF